MFEQRRHNVTCRSSTLGGQRTTMRGMSDVTLSVLAERAGVEPRVLWRAVSRGEIAAQRQRVGMKWGTAYITAVEAARVVRACDVARALGIPAAGILRAADVRQDGRIVTIVLPRGGVT